MTAKETVYTTVTMSDGKEVKFPGKYRITKSHNIDANGTITVRLDFVTGQFRTFTVPATMLARFAAFGAETKLASATYGLDTDKALEAVDSMLETLGGGEWSSKKGESANVAGLSVLALALMELGGKSADEVRATLKTLTMQEKHALRANEKVKPILARIEAAKAAKKAQSSDSNQLLASFIV